MGKKKKSKHIFSWIFAVFCFTLVLAYGFCFGSILLLAMGVMALPIQLIRNIWNKIPVKPNVIRPIILGIAFVFAIMVLPDTSTEPDDNTEIESETDNDSQEENEDDDNVVVDNNTVDDESGTEDNNGGSIVVPVIPSVTVEVKPTATPEITPTVTPSTTPEVTPTVTPTPTATQTPTKEPVSAPEEVAKFSFDVSKVPMYSGEPYVVVNKNVPYFTEKDLSGESYEYYSALDSLGRCGVCVASVGKDIMPTEERGSIGSVKPTGWHTVKYNGIIDGNYLYNRCHLIGYQLTGENANTKNLITGTRYLNVEGMLPFENMIADYVQETGNHVMFRVTPVFEGKNLVASGVLMEAKSVEDNGDGVLFNVYCYNVQPQIQIDYATGDSKSLVTTPTPTPKPTTKPTATPTPTKEVTPEPTKEPVESKGDYAVNAKNGKIHMVGECSATGDGSNAMTNPVYFDTYEDAESYSKSIKPSLDKRKCGNCW